MNAGAQQLLIALLAICSPFLLSFLIVMILSPRYKALAERNGWTVQPHPEDRRDYVFKGQQDGIHWEMELYIYEHYRNLSAKQIPFTNVIVWTSRSATLPQNTLLIYPRGNKLIHLVHPRLSLASSNIAGHENHLFALPEKPVGSAEFQDEFILQTDLADLPRELINRIQYELLSLSKVQFVGPVILLNHSGVTLWWIPIGMNNEWLERTVRLGINLAGMLKEYSSLSPQVLDNII